MFMLWLGREVGSLVCSVKEPLSFIIFLVSLYGLFSEAPNILGIDDEARSRTSLPATIPAQ